MRANSTLRVMSTLVAALVVSEQPSLLFAICVSEQQSFFFPFCVAQQSSVRFAQQRPLHIAERIAERIALFQSQRQPFGIAFGVALLFALRQAVGASEFSIADARRCCELSLCSPAADSSGRPCSSDARVARSAAAGFPCSPAAGPFQTLRLVERGAMLVERSVA